MWCICTCRYVSYISYISCHFQPNSDTLPSTHTRCKYTRYFQSGFPGSLPLTERVKLFACAPLSAEDCHVGCHNIQWEPRKRPRDRYPPIRWEIEAGEVKVSVCLSHVQLYLRWCRMFCHGYLQQKHQEVEKWQMVGSRNTHYSPVLLRPVASTA